LFAESNFTLISLVSPGAIGVFLGYSGTVHPQLPRASKIIRSLFPVFVKAKDVSTTSPSFMVPKSCSAL